MGKTEDLCSTYETIRSKNGTHTFLLTSAQYHEVMVSHNGPDFMKIERGHFVFCTLDDPQYPRIMELKCGIVYQIVIVESFR